MAPRAEEKRPLADVSPRSSSDSTRAPNTGAGATAPLPSAEPLGADLPALATRRWGRAPTAEERDAFAHGAARVRALEARSDARARQRCLSAPHFSLDRDADLPGVFERVARVLLLHLRAAEAEEETPESRGFAEALYTRRRNAVAFPLMVAHGGMLPGFVQAPREEPRPGLGAVLTFLERYHRCCRSGGRPYGAVVALVYLERLRARGVQVRSSNWRPLLLVTLVSAHKMYEDVYMTNRPFADVLDGSSLQHVGALERHFLAFLDYKLHVTAHEYARFYYAVCKMGPLRPAEPAAPADPAAADPAAAQPEPRRERRRRERRRKRSPRPTLLQAAADYLAGVLGDASMDKTRTGPQRKALGSGHL